MDIQERLDKLTDVIEKTDGREIGIVMTQIDPDAIASAFGLAFLIKRIRDTENNVTVYYCGGIGHPQNRTIINKYDLKRRMKPIEDLPSETAYTALVDSSSIHDGRIPEGESIEPIIVLDHHRESQLPEKDNTFYWIDDVGSASTLVAELLEAMGVEFDDENTYIATLLSMGVYTDTKALVSGSSRDRHAYGYATKATSAVEFSHLINYPFPESHFENLERALQRRKRVGSRLMSNVGNIPEEIADDMASIADYFLRMEGISLVVVWGIIGDDVRISARSTDLSTPLEEFMRQKFGPDSGAKLDPAGRGEGGALLDLDLGFWMTDRNQELVEKMVEQRLEQLMFGEETFPKQNMQVDNNSTS